jgi:hypothetical protein
MPRTAICKGDAMDIAYDLLVAAQIPERKRCEKDDAADREAMSWVTEFVAEFFLPSEGHCALILEFSPEPGWEKLSNPKFFPVVHMEWPASIFRIGQAQRAIALHAQVIKLADQILRRLSEVDILMQ